MNYRYDPDHPIQINCVGKILDANNNQSTIAVLAAAQVGADMQLDKCCEWLREEAFLPSTIRDFMAAMRPRPLSKREQALKILNNAIGKPEALHLMGDDIALIREVLMEGQGDA